MKEIGVIYLLSIDTTFERCALWYDEDLVMSIASLMVMSFRVSVTSGTELEGRTALVLKVHHSEPCAP